MQLGLWHQRLHLVPAGPARLLRITQDLAAASGQQPLRAGDVVQTGTVVFQVWADDPSTPSYASGTKLFDSGIMDATSPMQSVQVDVTGRRRLRLVVTNGGDGPSFDRASWGNAKIECAGP